MRGLDYGNWLCFKNLTVSPLYSSKCRVLLRRLTFTPVEICTTLILIPNNKWRLFVCQGHLSSSWGRHCKAPFCTIMSNLAKALLLFFSLTSHWRRNGSNRNGRNREHKDRKTPTGNSLPPVPTTCASVGGNRLCSLEKTNIIIIFLHSCIWLF